MLELEESYRRRVDLPAHTAHKLLRFRVLARLVLPMVIFVLNSLSGMIDTHMINNFPNGRFLSMDFGLSWC